MTKSKDITELRNELLEAFEWVRADPRRANQVKEMVNAAGKVVATIKTQLEYALLRGEQPEIDFMGKGSGKPLTVRAKALMG